MQCEVASTRRAVTYDSNYVKSIHSRFQAGKRHNLNMADDGSG